MQRAPVLSHQQQRTGPPPPPHTHTHFPVHLTCMCLHMQTHPQNSKHHMHCYSLTCMNSLFCLSVFFLASVQSLLLAFSALCCFVFSFFSLFPLVSALNSVTLKEVFPLVSALNSLTPEELFSKCIAAMKLDSLCSIYRRVDS